MTNESVLLKGRLLLIRTTSSKEEGRERRGEGEGGLCQAAHGLSSALISYCMYKSKAASHVGDSSKFLSFSSIKTGIFIDRGGCGLVVLKVSWTWDRPWMRRMRRTKNLITALNL